MKYLKGSILCAVFLAILIFTLPAAAQQSCESLKSIKIRNVTITSVEKGEPGYELAAQGGGFMNAPAQKIQHTKNIQEKAYKGPHSKKLQEATLL